MNPIDRAQLQRFDRYWRAVLAGDDPIRVRALAAAGLLEAFKQSNPKPPLYRLTAAGAAALSEPPAGGR